MSNSIASKTILIPILILAARIYYEYIVSFEYIVVSSTFVDNCYYLINGYGRNFLHLTGLSTKLNPHSFFIKCLRGTIEPTDFYINSNHQYNNCRLKLSVICEIRNIFNGSNVSVQENFNKGLVSCSFAAENNVLTLGFIKDGEYSYPMTLQKGCFLDKDLAGPITLLLRRQRKQKKFDDLLIGDIRMLSKYYSSFRHLLSDRLLDLVASLNNDK